MSNFTSAFSGAGAGTIALGMVKLAIDHSSFESDLKNAKTTFERNLAEMGQAGQRVRNVGFAMAGIGIGILTSLANAAAEEESAFARLHTSLAAANLDTTEFFDRVKKFTGELAIQVGVSDEMLADGYAKLLRATGDSEMSFKALTAAAQLSVTTGRDMETVIRSLMLGYMGSTRALKQMGIAIDDSSKGALVFDKVLSLTGGSIARFGKTTHGAWMQSKEAMDQAKESLGKSLLPIMTHLFTVLGDVTKRIASMDEAQLSAATNVVLFGTGIFTLVGVLGQSVMWTTQLVGVVKNLSTAFIAARASGLGVAGALGQMVGPGGVVTLAAIEVGLLAAAWYNAKRMQDAYYGSFRSTGNTKIKTSTGIGPDGKPIIEYLTAGELSRQTDLDAYSPFGRFTKPMVDVARGGGEAIAGWFDWETPYARRNRQQIELGDEIREAQDKVAANRKARAAGMPDQYYSQSQNTTLREQMVAGTG